MDEDVPHDRVHERVLGIDPEAASGPLELDAHPVDRLLDGGLLRDRLGHALVDVCHAAYRRS